MQANLAMALAPPCGIYGGSHKWTKKDLKDFWAHSQTGLTTEQTPAKNMVVCG